MEKNTDIFSRRLFETLRCERKARGISHEKLAQLSGLSRQAIGKIEAGERSPSMQNVYRLVRAMGMTMAEFIDRMGIDKE